MLPKKLNSKKKVGMWEHGSFPHSLTSYLLFLLCDAILVCSSTWSGDGKSKRGARRPSRPKPHQRLLGRFSGRGREVNVLAGRQCVYFRIHEFVPNHRHPRRSDNSLESIMIYIVD